MTDLVSIIEGLKRTRIGQLRYNVAESTLDKPRTSTQNTVLTTAAPSGARRVRETRVKDVKEDTTETKVVDFVVDSRIIHQSRHQLDKRAAGNNNNNNNNNRNAEIDERIRQIQLEEEKNRRILHNQLLQNAVENRQKFFDNYRSEDYQNTETVERENLTAGGGGNNDDWIQVSVVETGDSYSDDKNVDQISPVPQFMVQNEVDCSTNNNNADDSFPQISIPPINKDIYKLMVGSGPNSRDNSSLHGYDEEKQGHLSQELKVENHRIASYLNGEMPSGSKLIEEPEDQKKKTKPSYESNAPEVRENKGQKVAVAPENYQTKIANADDGFSAVLPPSSRGEFMTTKTIATNRKSSFPPVQNKFSQVPKQPSSSPVAMRPNLAHLQIQPQNAPSNNPKKPDTNSKAAPSPSTFHSSTTPSVTSHPTAEIFKTSRAPPANNTNIVVKKEESPLKSTTSASAEVTRSSDRIPKKENVSVKLWNENRKTIDATQKILDSIEKSQTKAFLRSLKFAIKQCVNQISTTGWTDKADLLLDILEGKSVVGSGNRRIRIDPSDSKETTYVFVTIAEQLISKCKNESANEGMTSNLSAVSALIMMNWSDFVDVFSAHCISSIPWIVAQYTQLEDSDNQNWLSECGSVISLWSGALVLSANLATVWTSLVVLSRVPPVQDKTAVALFHILHSSGFILCQPPPTGYGVQFRKLIKIYRQMFIKEILKITEGSRAPIDRFLLLTESKRIPIPDGWANVAKLFDLPQ